MEIVNEYRRQVGLPPEDVVGPEHGDFHVSPQKHTEATDQIKMVGRVGVPKPETEAPEQAEYDVERITAHHLSDPRTHPAGLGTSPVMLYQVKWKGYREQTWEPAASFADTMMLNTYKKRHGLPVYESKSK